jgi:hypothetical protein
MKVRPKTHVNARRAARPKADLGQNEAKLEKTQAELEQVSLEQLGHMGGGKESKAALKQKSKIERG